MPQPAANSHLLERLATFSERVTEVCGRAVAWLTLAMVLVTFAIVVMRYAFNTGWIAMQELVTYLHATVFMIGAAYALRHDAHVRVDIFLRRLSPRGRAWVDLLGTLFMLFPVFGFLIWQSLDYVQAAWAVHEGSPEAGGLPLVYLLKTLLLVMPALMILAGVALASRKLLFLLGREPAPPAEPHEGL